MNASARRAHGYWLAGYAAPGGPAHEAGGGAWLESVYPCGSGQVWLWSFKSLAAGAARKPNPAPVTRNPFVLRPSTPLRTGCAQRSRSPFPVALKSSPIADLPPRRGLPGGKTLSFASPRESNQGKGDPGSPPCASRKMPCAARSVGRLRNSAAAQSQTGLADFPRQICAARRRSREEWRRGEIRPLIARRPSCSIGFACLPSVAPSRAACPGGSRRALSERSAAERVAQPPRAGEQRREPVAQRRARQQGRLLMVTSPGEARDVTRLPGETGAACPHQPPAAQSVGIFKTTTHP